MTSRKDCDLELLRLLQMHMEYDRANLEVILRFAAAFGAGERSDLSPADAEFLVVSLFRYGRIAEARAVVQRRSALGHPLHAFDALVNSYEQLLRFDLRVPPPRHAPLFPGPGEPGKPRVLSFLHSSLPHQTSGYTLRSQALLENTGLEVASFTRIGFPWTADIVKNTKSTHRAEVNGVAYRSVRGGIASNNETFGNIALAKKAIVRLISQRRPDVVHAASNFTNALPAILAARQCGLPFVYEMRGLWELTNGVGVEDWTDSERYRLEKSIETAIARAADRVIALSEVQKSDLVERGVEADRVSVVANGHSPAGDLPTTFGFMPDVRARIRGRRVIGYVGAVARYEGLSDLVSVMARRPPELADTVLVIAGDGPALSELRRQVEHEGLHDEVMLLGRVPQGDALSLYEVIDVCVLPRTPSDVTRLITPLKPLEILARGKIMLVSDVAAMAEQTRAFGFGELFRAGDVDDLQQRLAGLVANLDGYRIRYAAAPSIIAQRFTWARSAEAWDAALVATAEAPRATEVVAADTLAGVHDHSPAAVRSRLPLRRRIARAGATLERGDRLVLRGPRLDPAALGAVLIEAGSEIAVQASPRLLGEAKDEGLYDLGSGYHGEADVLLYADRDAWPWGSDGRFTLFAQPIGETDPSANLRKLAPMKPEGRDIIALERRHRLSQEAEVEVASEYEETTRVAVSYVPLGGAQLQPNFDKLAHSKSIGARFVYQDLEPGLNTIRLLPRLAGPYMLEITPWGEAQLGAPSRIGGVVNIGYADREGSWLVDLDPAFTNVLVAANVNETLLDGSVVWLGALVSALAADPRLRIYVATNATWVPNSLTEEVFRRPNVTKVDLAKTGAGNAAAIAEELERIDRVSGGFDAIVARGPDLVDALGRKTMAARTVVYAVGLVSPATVEQGRIADELLRARLRRAAAVIVQQDSVAEIVRASVGDETRIHVIPPALPAALVADARAFAEAAAPDEDLVVYAGKLIREYGLLELLDAAAGLERSNPGFRLVILGSKFSGHDPEFEAEFMRRLGRLERVEWLRAVSQAEALGWAMRARAVWAWRHGEFETGHFEVSTKMVEALSSGAPPIVYPSPANASLLGADYPGFARTGEEAARVLGSLLGEGRAVAASALAGRGLSFDADSLYAGLRTDLVAMSAQRRGSDRRKILIASHDFRFIEDIEVELAAEGYVASREYWRNHTARVVHDTRDVSPGDTVHCEWCLGNAVWWSRNLPAGVRLTIRLHLQEISTEHPGQVDWSRVSRLIFVSPFIMRQAIEKFGIPEEICEVIPISVTLRPDREAAAPDRRNVLGMVGLTPWRKRPDLALKLFNRLRATRPGLVLRFKGASPSEYPWMAQRQDELAQYQEFFRDLRELEQQGLARFDGYDAAMEAFYAETGWILSLSDFEGCHTAVAEGGVMGCLPLMLNWGGADEVYDPRWVHADLDALADWFEQTWPRFDEVSADIREAFGSEFPLPRVWPAWRRALLGR